MHSVVGAGVGLALVLGLPGLLLIAAARVRVSIVETVALTPLLSLGAIWIGAEVCNLTGLRFGIPVYVGVVALAAGLAIWRWWAPRTTFVVDVDAVPDPSSDPLSEPPSEPEPRPTRRLEVRWPRDATRILALLLLLLGIAIGASTWARGLRGHAATPAGYDAAQHGLYVGRIERTGLTQPSDVVVSDTRGRSPAASYYPLALHASLALASSITGAGAADLLTGTVVAIAALALPCGLFALTRRLAPDQPLAAGFAALLVSLFALFPYEPTAWGGITSLVGTALVPGLLVLLERTVRAPLTVPAVLLAGLATMGLVAEHNSQAPVFVLLFVLLLVEVAAVQRSWAVLGRALVRSAVVGGAALVMFLPTVVSSFGGASERWDYGPANTLPLDFFLGQIITLQAFVEVPQGWLSLLALAGAAVLLWRHRPAWVIGLVMVLSLTVASAVSDSDLTGALTFAWYRMPIRLAFYLVYFVPVLGGIALAAAAAGIVWLLTRLTARVTTRRAAGPDAVPRGGAATWAPMVAVVVLVVGVVPAGGLAAVRWNREFIARSHDENAPVQSDSIAAFDWLGRHAPRDGLVAAENSIIGTDGAVWMYATSGANPILAAYPDWRSRYYDKSVREREYIVSHITDLGRDPRLEELLRRYKVEYLYFGERTYAAAPHQLELEQLRATPGLREVFSQGRAHVFRIRT